MKNAVLFGLLLCEGFILMGFEMLSSRFMNPYFGSSIDTWACIISVTLCSMALGYFSGGYLSATRKASVYLPIVTGISGLYLIGTSLFVHHALLWTIDVFDVTFLSTLAASFVLLAVPIYFLSFWSPIAIGLLSSMTMKSSSIAGYVYGVSTVGNVIGTLATAFILVPTFGSSTIALIFGVGLLGVTAIYSVCILPHEIRSFRSSALLMVLSAMLFGHWPTSAQAKEVFTALYPEGVFMESSELFYFTEMTADAISRVDQGRREVFTRLDGCGPTGLTRVSSEKFAVACHHEGSIRIIDNEGNVERTIFESVEGARLRNPNDINRDGQGGAYFSDPGPFSEGIGAVGRVFRLNPDGKVSLVASQLTYPNGVAYDSEVQVLFVNEHLKRRISAIELDQSGNFELSRSVVTDLAGLAEQEGWESLSGPDGLRLLPNGDLVAAVYGTSSVIVLSRCQGMERLSGYPKYTTSVGYDDGVLVVVGATSNSAFPFWGLVTSEQMQLGKQCD